MKINNYFLIVFLLLIFSARADQWQKLDQGLHLGEFIHKTDSDTVEARIYILKTDPARYDFRFLAKKDYPEKDRTVKQWCSEFKMAAGINAGMFGTDLLTHTGYVKDRGKSHNPSLNPSYGAFIVFNPKEKTLPGFQIVDKYGQDWKNLTGRYGTVIQNYRMISSQGKNLWGRSDKRYSTAAIGADKAGNALFIFCRYPYSTHDFNKILLKLPVRIKNACYLEGGPQANLYINVNNKKWDLFGSFEAKFLENDRNPRSWPVPNVIAVKKKK